MMLSVVVFPHPEGPSRDRNSPLYTSRSRLCRTGVAPYDMATPRSSTSMSTESSRRRSAREDRGPALRPVAELLADHVVVRSQEPGVVLGAVGDLGRVLGLELDRAVRRRIPHLLAEGLLRLRREAKIDELERRRAIPGPLGDAHAG